MCPSLHPSIADDVSVRGSTRSTSRTRRTRRRGAKSSAVVKKQPLIPMASLSGTSSVTLHGDVNTAMQPCALFTPNQTMQETISSIPPLSAFSEDHTRSGRVELRVNLGQPWTPFRTCYARFSAVQMSSRTVPLATMPACLWKRSQYLPRIRRARGLKL